MSGFSVTPYTQTVAAGVAATLTITQVTLSSPQVYALSDGGGGGVFSPTSVTIAGGVSSASFTYTNAAVGTYTLSVTPGAGPLSGQPALTPQVVVVSGSPPAPTGFVLAPSSNTAPANTPTPGYTIDLTNGAAAAVAGGGGQAFDLTSIPTGAVFAPSSPVTVPAGQSSVSFTVQSPTVGVATVQAAASGSPYLVNTATAQAVISAPGGSGSGGRSMGPLFKANGMEFGEAYLYGTLSAPDDTPFAKLQHLDFKVATALKEAMGPEQYVPIGVGISDRKYTVDLSVKTYSLQRFQMLYGGSAAAAVAAITDASTAPTLTATAGPTTFAAGFLAVAYAYRNKFGTTKISTIATVSLTSTQKANVTSLGALPAGVTSVDWYVGSAVYATAPLAAAAAVYYHSNNDGSAFSVTAFPTSTRVIPATSQIGVAGSSFVGYAYDQPALFNVHCVNPADGSQRNLVIYGCVCTDDANSMKLRDWTDEKITANVYGDTSTTPAKMFEWFAATSGGYVNN